MGAHIEEGSQITILASNHHDGWPRRIEDQPLAGLRQLAGETDEKGLFSEEFPSLGLESQGVGIDLG
jgi:hypothetical protein